jgi:HSP20 family protein
MAKDKEIAVLRSAESLPQRFDHQMERLFDDFFRRRWPRALSFDWPSFGSASAFGAANGSDDLPRVDVIDGAEQVVVRAEMPGVAAKDVEVSVSDSTITIRGATESDETQKDGDYWRREISRGTSARTVTLPGDIDAEHATARLKDGLLEVTLPKTAKAKRQRIAVSA